MLSFKLDVFIKGLRHHGIGLEFAVELICRLPASLISDRMTANEAGSF
jgi:hypothetical protein